MIRCPRQLDGRIEHLLAINTVRIELAIGLPAVGGDLVRWRSDWELRAHSRQQTIPDALFAIGWPETGEQVFALEVEHGTRAPRSFQTKLLRYSAASYRRRGIYGESNPVVLVVGHHPTWFARYRVALTPLALSITIGFANLGEIEREGAVGAVWQTQAGDNLSLRSLANWRCRNDRAAAETRSESTPGAASAAHKYPFGAIDEDA